MFDLVLRNGSLLTGDGSPALPEHDVAVSGGRIAEVGRRLGGPARREIRADGLCVCPGFIDMHSHSDLEALRTPESDYKILQGITAEVTGNCGFSLFPTAPPHGRA